MQQQQGEIPAGSFESDLRAARNSGMISSADVNGTDVYSPAGDHLGKISHLMIDRHSGNIAYAVMSFGGFLGLGSSEHPIPWKKLRYDARLGGYVTDITKDQLERAPRAGANWFDDPEYGRRSYEHYGLPYFR